MFYQKNVPGWERAIRVVMGLGMAVGGYLALHGVAVYAVEAMGVMLVATGFIGFCPMCALVGRRLPHADR